VLRQNVGYPVGDLNPKSLHFVLVFTLLHDPIPLLGIDSGIKVYALWLDSGFQ
jgi:hypothetical protein